MPRFVTPACTYNPSWNNDFLCEYWWTIPETKGSGHNGSGGFVHIVWFSTSNAGWFCRGMDVKHGSTCIQPKQGKEKTHTFLHGESQCHTYPERCCRMFTSWSILGLFYLIYPKLFTGILCQDVIENGRNVFLSIVSPSCLRGFPAKICLGT